MPKVLLGEARGPGVSSGNNGEDPPEWRNNPKKAMDGHVSKNVKNEDG